jgi:hypothetical protein
MCDKNTGFEFFSARSCGCFFRFISQIVVILVTRKHPKVKRQKKNFRANEMEGKNE